MKLNADIIKTAVLSYYRFKRQMKCVDEAWCGVAGEISDVLVESEKGFYDVEIKISKHDLWKGEARKYKHTRYKNSSTIKHGANYFIICVPESLLDEARKWVEEVNPNYGILVFLEDRWNNMCERKLFSRIEELVWVTRSPKRLHDNISPRLAEILIRRLCSAYITKRQREIIEHCLKEEESCKSQSNQTKTDKVIIS